MTKLHTQQLDHEVVLIIRDDSLVAGSICWGGQHWHVELLWVELPGTWVYDAPSLEAAHAFVAGVEQAWQRIGEDGASNDRCAKDVG